LHILRPGKYQYQIVRNPLVMVYYTIVNMTREAWCENGLQVHAEVDFLQTTFFTGQLRYHPDHRRPVSSVPWCTGPTDGKTPL